MEAVFVLTDAHSSIGRGSRTHTHTHVHGYANGQDLPCHAIFGHVCLKERERGGEGERELVNPPSIGHRVSGGVIIQQCCPYEVQTKKPTGTIFKGGAVDLYCHHTVQALAPCILAQRYNLGGRVMLIVRMFFYHTIFYHVFFYHTGTSVGDRHGNAFPSFCGVWRPLAGV